MKIGIQTWGSEGDIRPLLALAAGLRAAGHEVTAAVTHVANKDYTALGPRLGIGIRMAGSLPEERTRHAADVLVRETNVLKQVDLILRDLFDPVAQDMLNEARRLCSENDLVIGHCLVHPLRLAAERAGKPCLSVFLAPLLPTAFAPPPGMPHLGRWMNAFFWALGGRMMDRMFLTGINGLRTAEDLAPVRSVLREAYLSPMLNLVASSPALFPRPADWDPTVHVCGAFHYPDTNASALPEEIERFLGESPPPVYMTIGSMSVADPVFPDTLRMLAEASRLAGCRAIIQTEGASVPEHPGILFIERAEHDLVFPRCAAVVHHGGAGTTHAASRAGVPSVVIEHVTDQVFWGGVLHRQGISPRTLHRRTVTASKLARAIKTALGSTAMRERACIVGKEMRQEDGVKRAIELIEKHVWQAGKGIFV